MYRSCVSIRISLIRQKKLTYAGSLYTKSPYMLVSVQFTKCKQLEIKFIQNKISKIFIILARFYVHSTFRYSQGTYIYYPTILKRIFVHLLLLTNARKYADATLLLTNTKTSSFFVGFQKIRILTSSPDGCFCSLFQREKTHQLNNVATI